MSLRTWFLTAALATAVFASSSAIAQSAQAAVGGTVHVVKKFDDPRGDWKSRPGKIAIVRYGPFTVPGASMDEPGMIENSITSNLPAPCKGCFVTDLVPSLVAPDGSDSNFDTGTMLHHFVLFNPAERDATCPNGLLGVLNLGERFFASGSERTHNHFPRGYGYYNASDRWSLIADLMNMRETPQQVYLQIVVRYRKASAHLKRVKPLWLDVNNCGTSDYPIPRGKSDTDWSWKSNLSGSIIGIGGHQHDLSAMEMECMDAADCPDAGGGTAITAELVGGKRKVHFGPKPRTGPVPADLTGATICRSEDRYDTPFGMDNGFMGHLDTMTGCGLRSGLARRAWGTDPYPAGGFFGQRGFPLKAGQTIRLHSQYTNPGAPRSDVMGIMVAYLSRK